jgi:hypothetical protein
MENKKRLSSSVFVFLPFYLSYYINDMFHIGCKSESNFYFNVGQDYDDLSSIYYRSDKHRMAADERKRPGSKSRCHFIPPDCARGSDTSIENNTAGNTYRNRKIKRVRERERGRWVSVWVGGYYVFWWLYTLMALVHWRCKSTSHWLRSA